MADVVEVTGTYGTYYYIDSSSTKDVLSWEQMKQNALYFYSAAADMFPTWSLNAICGMLGNIRYEGIMNPSQWQYGLNKSLKGGYGLTQWTPATKFINWAAAEGLSRTSIDTQVARIGYEAANKLQWIATSKYNLSFETFLKSGETPSYLASAWLYDYERPLKPADTESYRKDMADTWYLLLSGEEPEPPEPPEPPTPIEKKLKGMPLYMYPCFRK